MSAPITGWWFAKGANLPNGDGRPVVIGEWLTVAPPIIPCEHGLHLSVRAIDAIQYAYGTLCFRVEGMGEIVEHNGDKHACSERRALWMIDAEPVLRRAARQFALDVVHLWEAPEIVVRYLATGDESIRDTARDAAWAAARDTAWAATRDAAWAAAWAAARDTAWAATRDAAWAAAWAAARARQNAQLEAMLFAHHDGTLDLSAPLEATK